MLVYANGFLPAMVIDRVKQMTEVPSVTAGGYQVVGMTVTLDNSGRHPRPSCGSADLGCL